MPVNPTSATRATRPVRLTRRHLLKGAALAGAALVCHSPASLLAAPASAASEEVGAVHTQTRLLMGTFVTLSVVHPSAAQAEEGMGRAFEEISRLENTLSRHKESPLRQLNASGRLLDAPGELLGVLDRAMRVRSITNGAFDVTVAPVLDLFRAHSNPKGRLVLDPAELAAARELVCAEAVHRAPDHVRLGRSGMALTLDGIAKGYIVDCASTVLAAHGLSDHLVNAGGDIRASGRKAPGQLWRVGVEHPVAQARNAGRVATAVNLTAAIATSGSYEVFYDASHEHHHLIDPVAKASPQHTVSVTVTAPTAVEADALATALSVMDEGDALRLVRSLPGRECCLLAKNGAMLTSEGWGRA